MQSGCFELDGKTPRLGKGSYVAPGAMVIGDVLLEDDVSVWFNAVLRGDNDRIVIGARSNIQECAVLHVDPAHPIAIGSDVTVGHQAMLHGCRVEDGALIGIHAVVLNDALVGAGSLIGANALVPEGMIIPPRSLVLGSPARVVRELDDAAVARMAEGARHYVEKSGHYREKLKPLPPVTR